MLNNATEAGAGDTLIVLRDQEIRWDASLVGTGAVTAEWVVEYVDGGGAWRTWRTAGLSGTDSVSSGDRWRSPGTQLRANLLSITGTDASLTVTAYTSGAPVQPITARAAAGSIRQSDAGRVLVTSDAEAATIDLISPIHKGWRCTVVQGGAGAITFDSEDVTINNRQSHTDTAGQHAVVTLTATDDDVVVLAGDTASGS